MEEEEEEEDALKGDQEKRTIKDPLSLDPICTASPLVNILQYVLVLSLLSSIQCVKQCAT